MEESDIVFSFDGEEVMKFESDGRIFIRDELVDDNQRVYSAMLDFLTGAGYLDVTRWEDGEEISVDDL